MAITRLQRRQKKNRLNAIKKQQTIKDLLFCPVIKNLDVEALKAEFEKKAAALKEVKTEVKAVKAEEKKVEKKKVVKEKSAEGEKKKTTKAKTKTSKA